MKRKRKRKREEEAPLTDTERDLQYLADRTRRSEQQLAKDTEARDRAMRESGMGARKLAKVTRLSTSRCSQILREE